MIPSRLNRRNGSESEEGKDAQDSRDENPPRGVGRSIDADNCSSHLVELLMERIHDYFDGADPQASGAELDPSLALQLLEASSGDVDVAAGFFWDNYLANASRLSSSKKQKGDYVAQKRIHADRHTARKSPPEDSDQEEKENEYARAVRQRLEGRFNREDEHHADVDLLGQEHPYPPEGNEDQGDELFDNADAIAGSVSVSDDEGAGIWRMARQRRHVFQDELTVDRNVAVGNLSRNVSNGADCPPPDVGTNIETPPTVANDESQNDIDDDESYLSDDDWFTCDSSREATPQPPLNVLWGSSQVEHGQRIDDDVQHVDMPSGSATIPATWLHAGFKMSQCGGGLTISPPSDEDIVYHRWKQQQNAEVGDVRNTTLPPFHCKALTAIVAVVNATMLTGASIQGNCVDCSSAKASFTELPEKERKRDFIARLVDAIAALLFVAFKASTARKQRAIEARAKQTSRTNKGNGDFDQMQRQMIARKLRLCPSCRWHQDPPVGEGAVPDARDASVIEVITSFTNVSDLRSYVKSNLRSFVGKRGCALLLENIVRIHGKGTVERMVYKSRKRNELPIGKFVSLIHCTCEERQRNVKPGVSSSALHFDTTPPGHECISIELLSLLICGEVHSTFSDWSSGSLGFGIISNESVEVDERLAKPPKPVWILRGDTCHTIAWVDTAKHPQVDLDQQGAVIHMSHWNPWYGIRNRSGFRVNVMRREWSPALRLRTPTEKKNPPESNSLVLLGIWERKQHLVHQQISNSVSRDELDDEASKVVSPTDLNSLQVKVDDQIYYPGDYRRWRYRFEESAHCGQWKSFHSLSERERRLVEMKLGPRINLILWSRWPNCIVDKFVPEGEAFPIV